MVEIQFQKDHGTATSGAFERIVPEGDKDLFPPAVKGAENGMFFF